MWFWFAIAAMLCWSGSDIFSKVGSRPDDKYSHWKMVIAVGTVMGLHALYEIFISGVSITWGDMLRYLPAAGAYILSMIFGYVGLRYIELSVSSPICNSSGAFAALLCFVLLGQRLTGWATFAVVLICLGVFGLGVVEMTEDEDLKKERQLKANIKYSKSFLAILFPILYCVIDAFGTYFDAFLLETMEETTANVAYELTFLMMAVLAFIYVVIIRKQKLTVKREGPKAIGAVFETVGQFAYVFALSGNAVAAAPIISAYCLFSALWSHIFLKEKLSWKHYIMLAVAIAGIILLGALEEA